MGKIYSQVDDENNVTINDVNKAFTFTATDIS